MQLLAAAVLLVGLAACGSAGDGGEVTPETGQTVVDGGPRVADVRFEGDFLIVELTLDGQPVTLEAVASMNFETEFGGLVVEPGCNRYFGSFTLNEDGTASFSVAGGENRTCDGLEQQDRLVIQALAAVSSWSESADGFRLDGPGGQSVTVQR